MITRGKLNYKKSNLKNSFDPAAELTHQGLKWDLGIFCSFETVLNHEAP